MAAEDETFRVLIRRPLTELYPIIRKKINYNTTLEKATIIVGSYGYSLSEFLDYDEEYMKRKNEV